jgi:alkanesulfonate monooxygenase SsuD/methylene tetrahydromethanopterin reductase-like flavin-dependent oxidoreductase (luciferase family)
MKLGLFGMPLHPAHRPRHETYEEVRQRIIFGDKLGFEEAFIGEHISCNTEPIASPLIFLASLIHETKLRLGTGVVALPNHHPAIVAAEIAQFDNMSLGRLNFGVGPGGLASDMELFDVLDNELRGRKMYDALDVILDIWRSDPPYRYDTEFFNFGIEQTVIPEISVGSMLKPYQQPHPPIFSTAMSPYSSSIKIAVERGWAPMSANFCGEAVIASHWKKYVEGAETIGKEPTGDEWRVARNIVIRDTDAEAEESVLDPSGPNYFYIDYLWTVLKAANYTAVMKEDDGSPVESVKIDDLLKDIVIYGSPETVTAKLTAMREKYPFGHLLMTILDGEGKNEAGERQSMERLVNEVLPYLN